MIQRVPEEHENLVRSQDPAPAFNSVDDQWAVVKHEGDSQLASVSLALRYRRHSSSILVRRPIKLTCSDQAGATLLRIFAVLGSN